MTPAQQNYVRQCYADYKATFGWCKKCDPDPAPVRKRWDDAVHAVVKYADSLGIDRGFPRLREAQGMDVASYAADPINTWGGGVFKGDDYDGPCGWYWRINKADSPTWGNTPADALLSFVAELERRLEADPAAKSLVFIVRLPKNTCQGEDHDWEHLYTGRHGSDKGDDFYKCRICGEQKRE